MFVAWILNFLVNLRKIICLEPYMKLESQEKEVFFYQNMHFLQARLFKGQIQIRNKSFQFTAYLCATPYTVIFTQDIKRKVQHANLLKFY